MRRVVLRRARHRLMLLRFVAWFLVGWLLFGTMPSIASTDPGISITDIQYSQVNGQPTVNIMFDQVIRYRNHFPTRQGRRLTIQFEPSQSINGLRSFQTDLPVPPSNIVPLEVIQFGVEDGQAFVILRFTTNLSFHVSQTAGANSLSVVFDDMDTREPPLSRLDATQQNTVKDRQTPQRDSSRMFFKAGLQALREENNKLAIKIFSKVLSLEKGFYTQDAMELLGVARERNEQYAQAKLIYRSYLKTYPSGQKNIRVKQRLGELLAGDIPPKSRLKNKTRVSSRNSKKLTQFTGLLQQTYFKSGNSLSQNSSISDQSFFSSQVSGNWRYRDGNTDLRSFIYISHDYDYLVDNSSNVKINSMYAKYRNRRNKLFASIGRQTSNGGGVLGRFDGINLAYDIHPKMKLSGSFGSPLDYTRKDRIQKEKRFQSLSLQLNDYIRNWFIVPYVLLQKNEGIKDREVLGLELRYFSDRASLFNVIDYDILFDALNVFILRGQYSLASKTSINFSVDKRKTPLLETSNAAIGTGKSMRELANELGEDQLVALALEKSGDSTIATLGITQNINRDWQISSDVTTARSTFKNILEGSLATTITPDEQTYYNLQLVRYRLFQQADTVILTARQAQTKTYDELMTSISHRLLFSTVRLQSRLRIANRKETTGLVTTRIRPSVKLDVRKFRDVYLHFTISFERWSYNDNSLNDNFSRTDFDVGYQWNF